MKYSKIPIISIFLFLIFCNSTTVLNAQIYINFAKYEESKQPAIKAELKKYAIKTGLEQQKEVLSGLLRPEIKCWHFTIFASYFQKAFNAVMLEKSKSIWADLADWDWELTDFDKMFNEGYYDFQALDFDKNGKADLFLIPSIFFGPSFGLIAYGYIDGKISHLFDKAGYIVTLKKEGKNIILQFETTIIEDTETNVLETVIFNLNNKKLRYDNKLYYATQCELPKTSKILFFETTDSICLRSDKTVNDSIRGEEWYNYGGLGTKTLRGNVLALCPKNANGYLIAEENNYAFVAMSPETPFIASSMQHGMENSRFDEELNEMIFEPNPKPYLCGWVEKKYLKLSPELKLNKNNKKP